MRKKILDLFCGAGGFAAGFQAAGYEIKAAIDLSYSAYQTYKYNFPKAVVFNENIHELHTDDILDRAKMVPDVIIAAPPCEAYTSANTKREKVPLNGSEYDGTSVKDEIAAPFGLAMTVIIDALTFMTCSIKT